MVFVVLWNLMEPQREKQSKKHEEPRAIAFAEFSWKFLFIREAHCIIQQRSELLLQKALVEHI